MKLLFFFFLSFLTAAVEISPKGRTIAEKKSQISKSQSDLPEELDLQLRELNLKKKTKEESIRGLYQKGWELYSRDPSSQDFKSLLAELKKEKQELYEMDLAWRQKAAEGSVPEPYGLFHQPKSTIEQLVIDYGSQDFVYLMPKEVADLEISLSSNLPIPRSSWNEMLEIILNESGIAITQVSPYLRKLSLAKDHTSQIKQVVSDRSTLSFIPKEERLIFFLTVDPTELRQAETVLEKFSNKKSQQVIRIGRHLALISTRGELEETLRLFDFMRKESGGKDYTLVTLSKVSGEEMARMLALLFDESLDKQNKAPLIGEVNALRVMASKTNPYLLFLVGTSSEVKKAEEIIRRVEGQMGDHKGKILHWYTAKHASPQELANVLDRIYQLFISQKPSEEQIAKETPLPNSEPEVNSRSLLPDQLYKENFYQSGNVAINPAPIGIGDSHIKTQKSQSQNFLVDSTTGSILMVIEADVLPKIKEIIRRLDVPKKMVQIEVLLFEKKSQDRSQFGLNLAKVGEGASNTNTTSLLWNEPSRKGILDFFISRASHSGFSPFDLVYSFLISQEDVQINAAPSVLTINQTPAKISIVEEISINTGIYDVETAKGTTLKDSFTRSQYGIKLDITPTIHLAHESEHEECDSISLNTTINFDTFQPLPGASRERPDITRREIKNETVVADGQSVILGGLRRNVSQVQQDKIPYIGDIPWIGKFFSFTSQHEMKTEMFIVITPKIVRDPGSELEKIKLEEMCRRPGDLPPFLHRLETARRRERESFLAGTIEMMQGPKPSRNHSPAWKRDGVSF